ncbi:ABC transporter substrate-binding protein [Kribbella solani]|uniref:Multiple sugar transport system substrate-binding protein n=1 Tax=Kribbella solani TaxID=236067 RepID=A0A841DL61_9ACTN|nr:extracellular solute-binding protein [Kribbella solani]MBB5977410.1 multiple sugar transport system substrate-binding protein [Kribbella solani]
MKAAGLVIALATGLALVGCAPSTGSKAGGSGGEQGSGSGTVKMVLWPGPEGDAMSKVVDAYNAGQGSKDKIKVEMTLLSRQDTFSKEATLMAAKSNQQDIYFVASYNVGQYANSLDPLTSVDASNYFPVAVDGLKYQDKQYALPLDVSNHFLLYRKDLVDTLLGTKSQWPAYQAVAQRAIGERRDPKPAAEWDWNDYTAMAAWFSKTANPSSPTRYGTILQAKNLLYNTMIWDDVLWGSGGSWTTPDGKANLDTPAAAKAVGVYSTIYKNGWTSKDSSQAEFPETQAALKAGTTAFALQRSAGFAELNDKTKSPLVAGKLAIAPVPGQKTHVHALAVALNKYSENKDAATKFLNYLATKDAMSAYAEAGGIPAMPSVLQDKASINPAFPQIAESIDKYGYSVPVFPNTFQAYSKIAESLSGAWVGQQDAGPALKTANAALEKLLG